MEIDVMRPITRDDVLDVLQYEKGRRQSLAYIIALKNERRISVGPWSSLVFENRETVLFQIQEVMRARGMVREEAVSEEIRWYNVLIPDRGELSATLFIEVTESEQISRVLPQFEGVTRGGKAWLEFGGERVFGAAVRETSQDAPDLDVVHFLRFYFNPGAIRRFRSGEDEARVVIGGWRATMPGTLRERLIGDLENE